MNYYISLPKNVDNLIDRLKVKATADNYTAIVAKINTLEKTTFYNLPYKLNKLVDILEDYQLLAEDGDLQDILDSIGEVYWFRYLSKVNKILEAVELIEEL